MTESPTASADPAPAPPPTPPDRPPPHARRLEVRLVRRLPAHPAQLRGRAARRGRAGPGRLLPGGHPCRRRRPLRHQPRRGLDHHPGGRGADPAGAGAPRGRWSRSGRARPAAASRPCATSPTSGSSCRSSTPILPTWPRCDRSTPISAHVTVDFQLRGCPIDKGQLLEVLAALLQGRRPRVPSYSVCVECKRRGTVCVAVADGMPCLGPVTQAGCGALCPSYHRGCYGCFGPHDTPNTASLAERLRAHGMPEVDVHAVLPDVQCRVRALPGAEPGQREADPPGAVESDRRTVGIVSTSLRAPRGGGTMTHKLTGGSYVLSVDTLARVEGEGGMHVHVQDGEVEDVHLRIFEPPRFFEAFLRGRALHRAAGHHRPHLRDLPGGLPVQRVPGDRGRLRGRRPRRDPARCAGCSTAASGSRATPCTSSSCTPRTCSATTARSRWPATTAAWSSRALRIKRAGNELMTVVGGRSVHPVNVRVGGFHRLPRP